MGKKNNQKFIQIPHAKLIDLIIYKAEEVGIKVILTEESYTSKVDHLAKEPLQKQTTYLGQRIKRGLFQSSTGKLINADINGALGILRKKVSDNALDFPELISRGLVLSPFKIKGFL